MLSLFVSVFILKGILLCLLACGHNWRLERQRQYLKYFSFQNKWPLLQKRGWISQDYEMQMYHSLHSYHVLSAFLSESSWGRPNFLIVASASMHCKHHIQLDFQCSLTFYLFARREIISIYSCRRTASCFLGFLLNCACLKCRRK